jgi:hypothetical protein
LESNIVEEIKMATELLMEISRDERQRAIIRSRRMYETDQISNMLTAERRGEKRGRTEVIELLEKGVPIDEIKKMLEL